MQGMSKKTIKCRMLPFWMSLWMRNRWAGLRFARRPCDHAAQPPRCRQQPSWTFLRRPTCRAQNPDIPQAGRGGAAHGGVLGWGEARQDGTPTGRFAQEITDPLAPQGVEETCPERLSGSTIKRNPKPMGEHSGRLTSGLSAGRRLLFVPGC